MIRLLLHRILLPNCYAGLLLWIKVLQRRVESVAQVEDLVPRCRFAIIRAEEHHGDLVAERVVFALPRSRRPDQTMALCLYLILPFL